MLVDVRATLSVTRCHRAVGVFCNCLNNRFSTSTAHLRTSPKVPSTTTGSR